MIEKIKKNKKIGLIVLTLIALIGVTYAYFNYYGQSENRKLVAGDVYLEMDETGGFMELTNAFPETAEKARSRDDNIITFSIDGRNSTTNKTIYYEIMLSEGEAVEGASVRIRPEHLRFDLVEIIDGVETMVVKNKTYNELQNKRIWVNQVNPGTANITINYELRVWIDENVFISDTNDSADYKASTWKDTYASIVVSVYGDFQEKDMSSPATCFAYEETSLAPVGVDAYSFPYVSYKLNTTTSGINSCKNYFLDFFDGNDNSTAGDGYQTFCEGTGTVFGKDILTLDFYVKSGMLDNSGLVDANIITNYKNETRYYTLNTSDTAVNACMDYMLNDFTFAKLEGFAGTDESDAGDGYQSFCQGTGTIGGYTLKVHMENSYDDVNYLVMQVDVDNFIANGVLTELEPTVGLAITDYDIDTCGPDVVIPSKINGVNVISISGIEEECASAESYKKFDNYTNTLEYRKTEYDLSQSKSDSNLCYTGAFQDKGITSVVIPNTIQYIDHYAFAFNNLTELVVPASVTEIGEHAFYSNYLETVDVKSAAILGDYIFSQDDSIILFKYGGTCEQLKSYNAFIYSYPETVITSDNNACMGGGK